MQLLLLGMVALTSCQHGPRVQSEPPAPEAREISFKANGLDLVGTLQFAKGGLLKSPAILLLPGSGPTDRDGNSSLGIKTDILKQIAESLASAGIASLRFDKRAIARYSTSWPKTVPEQNTFFGYRKFIDDASRAFDFLRAQPEIDSGHVGILGHSEGALISLQIGADRAGTEAAPKFTLLLGSTGRPMGPILREQIGRQLKMSGASAPDTKIYLDYVAAACEALVAGKELPKNAPLGLGGLFNETSRDIVTSYLRIDPSVLAKSVRGPVLVINGTHDMQVSSERDSPPLIAALKSRPSGSVDFLMVPDASHNLKNTKGGTDDAFLGPIVPIALRTIIEFARKNL